MTQPMTELKEPLISIEGKKKILGNDFFKSYFKKVYPSAFPESENQGGDGDYQNEEHHESQKSLKDGVPVAPEGYQPVNYVEKFDAFADNHFSNGFMKEYYRQATAVHEIPALNIVKTQIFEQDPSIFATWSKSAEAFNHIEVKEFICQEDYKLLTKLRIRNYVHILRMLSNIDKSSETYQEIKIKLYQIKQLTSFLGLTFDKLYERLHKNEDIYDIPEDESKAEEEEAGENPDAEHEGDQNDEDKQGDEENKEDPEEKNDEEKSSSEEEEEEEEENYHDEEQEEYEEFFKNSQINNGYRQYFSHELEREELKWLVRVEWLENKVKSLKENEITAGWVAWFQAKLDELADLDVPVQNVSDSSSNQVFYMQKFYDEKTKSFDREQEYQKDLGTYVEQQDMYPKIKTDLTAINNEDTALVRGWQNIRMKLCRRITNREKETDYILTIFKKKPLGNEKIYEKRINVCGKSLYDVDQLYFSQNGAHVYIMLNFSGHEQGLVFPINAPNKDPILVKPDSYAMGFIDKFFYSVKQCIQPKPEKPASLENTNTLRKSESKKAYRTGDHDVSQEEGEAQRPAEVEGQTENAENQEANEGEGETNENGENEEKEEGTESEKDEESEEKEEEDVKFLRIFEYDLQDNGKVRYIDIKDGIHKGYDRDYCQSYISEGKLAFFKDSLVGYAAMRDTDDYQGKLFDVYIRNELHSMDVKDQIQNSADPVFCLNEKGDRAIGVYWKDGILTFQRYIIDPKDKKVKKEKEIKPITDQFVPEKNKVEIKIVRTGINDFVFYIRSQKAKKTFIFYNETFITSYDGDSSYFKAVTNEKGLSHLIYQDYDMKSVSSHSQVKYLICSLEGEKDKKEWIWRSVAHDIINRQQEVCFPYAFFLYNHDQVYIKDLSQDDRKGYYYMNSFLGIDQKFRPLTIHAITYNNKIQMSVPTINSNYTASDFIIKVHQIKSKNQSTTPFKFQGCIRYRIYAFSQEIMGVISQWLDPLADRKGKLYQDIKIVSKYNSMQLERWEKNRCTSRIIVSHFHYPTYFANRDVTQKDSTQLDYKEYGYWFIILQKPDSVTIFQREMRYNFHFPELQSLESSFEYLEDDQNNEIYTVLVDSLIKDKLEFYIVYTTGVMKKFSSLLQNYTLAFEESLLPYSVESLFKGMAKEGASSGDKASSGASKKTNINEQYTKDMFITNQMFYSQAGIVDLKANTLQDKTIVGLLVDYGILKETEKIKKFTYSYNEAKIAVFYEKGACRRWYGEEYPTVERNSEVLIITSLYNTRQLPQFNHRQFKHSTVPMIDQRKGFTSVFSLTLGNQQFNSYYTALNTHSYERQKLWDKLINVNPGLHIKYFNGIEHEIPMWEQGEYFDEILRFRQSQDGQFVVIIGKRRGPLGDDWDYTKKIHERESQAGIFLYKVTLTSVKFVKAFLFAEKDISKVDDEKTKNKFNAPLSNIREYVEPEIKCPQIGEYNNDYIDNDGCYNSTNYYDEIDYKQYDEDYVEKLRKENAEKKRVEEEAKRKEEAKNQNKNVKKSVIAAIDSEQEGFHQSEHPEQQNEEQPAADDDLPQVHRLQDFLALFPGLDIPYYHSTSYQDQAVKEHTDKICLAREYENPILQKKETDETANPNAELLENGEEKQAEEQEQEPQCFSNQVEKDIADYLSSQDREKINLIHCNMAMDINDNGHIFMINRMNNTLYFFYQIDGKFKLYKQKFEHDFPIISADSSGDFLVVWGQHRYRVLSLQTLLRPSEQENLSMSIRTPKSPKKQQKTQTGELTVLFDSKIYESDGVKKEVVGLDEYTYDIYNCMIHGSRVILKISDSQGVTYVKVFDFLKMQIIFYIEGERFLLSGDKKFLWIMTETSNYVYDIHNGLSTLFFWPGDLINTHAYDHMSVFNITEDRTMMITQGYILTTFTLITFKIDEQLREVGNYTDESIIINKCKNFSYIFFKNSDYSSILERCFIEDYDKTAQIIYEQGYNYVEPEPEENQEPKKKKTEEDWQNEYIDKLAQQAKCIQTILNYITNNYVPEKNNPDHITNFFLSYYLIDQVSSKSGSGRDTVYLNIFQKMFQTPEKRVDLIEEILNYVVSQQGVPIVQNVINSCFTHFLSFANTSQAFQSYLNNITIQTKVMKDIEKFQIISNEAGYQVSAHDSPIIDDRFYSKFRILGESKKDVEIQYINLGNLLSEHGASIMETLTDKKYLAIMDIPFMKYLVMYQWLNIKDTIMKRLLYPFFSLLILFTLYTMNIDFSNQVYPVEGEALEEPTAFMKLIIWINALLLLSVLGYFLHIEFIQFTKKPSEYFSSFWNLIDLISYSMCVFVILFNRFNVANSINRPIASLCLIILWIKMFYFLRVYESTSRLIRMIIEIVNDMKNFLIVLIIGLLGFTGGFFILQQGVDDREAYVENGGSVPGNSFQSFIYTYRLANGDFNLDFFDDLPGIDYYLAWFLFVFGSLFLVIVLLNLLIAIMGDTFSRVLENITNLSVREKVMLVAENENLFERDSIFQQSQFLVIITEKNLEGGMDDNWDGQINALKREVLTKVSTLQTDLDTKITENQKELKKKINDQEDRSRRQNTAQEQKIQGHVKTEFESALTKISEQFKLFQTENFKAQEKIAVDHQRTVKVLMETIETVKTEQKSLSQNVYKALGVDVQAKNTDSDEE